MPLKIPPIPVEIPQQKNTGPEGIIIPPLPEVSLQCVVDKAALTYKLCVEETRWLRTQITECLEPCKKMKMKFLLLAFSKLTLYDKSNILMKAERGETVGDDWTPNQKKAYDCYVSEHRNLMDAKKALQVSVAAEEEARIGLVYAEDDLARYMRYLISSGTKS